MRRGLAILAMLWLAVAVRADIAVDGGRLERSVAALTALPHRLAGSDSGRAAGDSIIKALRDAGIAEDQLLIQPFEVTQLHMEAGACYFEHGGQRVPMQPLRPNGLALPVTPAEGLEAATVYLGDGQWERYRGQVVRGQIAVLDYDSAERWREAVQAGAAAIVFVGPARGEGAKWLYAHAEVPRFFVEREAAERHGLLRGERVRLFSRMGLRRGQGRNIYVLIPGRPGAGTQEEPSECVMLAGHYDTFGPMPMAVPGVRGAGNVAALIEAAAHFNRERPGRSVLVAFFDNNAQDQAGQLAMQFARMSYAAQAKPGTTLAMIADRDRERQALEQGLEALRDTAALVSQSNLGTGAVTARQALLSEIEHRYDLRVSEVGQVRGEISRLERAVALARRALEGDHVAGASAEELARRQARHDAATRERDRLDPQLQQLSEQAQQRKQVIHEVRKLVSAGQVPRGDAPGAGQLFEQIVADARELWRARLAEIEREKAELLSHQALGARLDGLAILSMAYFDLAPAARRWTVTAPGSGLPSSVTNQQALRRIDELAAAARADHRWPTFGGAPRGVAGSPELWSISSLTTFVIEVGHNGLTWPNASLPSEPAADVHALSERLGEALDFVTQWAQLPELSRVRLPQRTPALVFNTPTLTAGGYYDGCAVRSYDEQSKAGHPAAGAGVFIHERLDRPEQLPPAESWGGRLATSNAVGVFSLMTRQRGGVVMSAAEHDDQGRIARISQLYPGGGPGLAGAWESPGWFQEKSNNQLLLFAVRSRSTIAGLAPPVDSAITTGVQVLDGVNDSPPKRLSATFNHDMLALYSARLQGYKILHGAELLLNNSLADPAGAGYEPAPSPRDATATASHDLWTLNEARLDNLRRHQVQQDNLERLHTRAQQLREQAQQVDASDPGMAWAQRLAALMYSSRVYQPARAVTNDLIQAVVIILLLAIPFSFALERLIVGTPNVYRQIAGFSAVFIAVFAVLYLVHPAFQFASYPVIVLLAFVIIVMSSSVIAIMWGKFNYELRKLHGVAMVSHQSTRSARTTLLAAVAQGIATMRRRPLRTFLTALTVMLLTFTILFFGSFSAEGGTRVILGGPSAGVAQVEVRARPGSVLSPRILDMLRMLWSDTAPSTVRQWHVAELDQAMAGRLPDDEPFWLAGWASVTPETLAHYPKLRAALAGDVEGFMREGGIFLPASTLPEDGDASGVRHVDFAGRRWALRGRFDPVKLRAARTFDGAGFIPPDLREARRQLELQHPRDPDAVDRKLQQMELADLPALDPQRVAILWDPRMDRDARYAACLVLLPRTDADARRIALESATLLDQRVSFTVGRERYAAIYSTQLSVTGLAAVAVPLLLGGLLVFSTMLSSVSDREREIFTFSALGLAPRHVAALFFAEAAVYAVIGGMGGYLLAQAFAKLAQVLARQGLVEAPAMNYSSMNGMVTLLIVMATVMVSTIYPAYKASRSANPGIQRRWRMPEPDGDHLAVQFPFTVSAYDMVGLASFLEEYLQAHRDKSVGSFAADAVTVTHEAGRFTLSAEVWLQPFDQGVSQRFELATVPSDIEGIDEVHLSMTRVSGSPAIWRRSNRLFAQQLRQQFIYWRTIPGEATQHYHQRTAERFGLKEPSVGS